MPCFLQLSDPLQSASVAAVHLSCWAVHLPATVQSRDWRQSSFDAAMHPPCLPVVH